MIKGIYNENEFYYENYWENKLPNEIKNSNSQISNIDDLRNQLKSAANIFWDIKGMSAEDEAYLDCINNFYKIVIESLGFTYQERKFETKDGNFSSFLTDLEGINIFGCTENETGDFDQVALSTLELGDEESRDDRPLVELINEELENENSNKWSIVLAPNSMYLLERSKWLFGRFIKFDWDEIFGINDTENYNFIIGLCHKKTLLPKSGQSIHDGFDEESHRHAFGVTTQLREGVRESIELIVNELLRKHDLKGIHLERNDNLANDLTHDALIYVYRLIFMLYLEAQGSDSDLLPLKSEIYREGYTLDKLLDSIENEVLEGTAQFEGTFLFESLNKIYNLIFNGFNLKLSDDTFLGKMQQFEEFGFLLKGVKSSLFDNTKMKYIGDAELSNGCLQEIFKKLTITKEMTRSGFKTGRISYAKLGINQLGAVYEGLLSYTGYFAHEDLYALKPNKVKQSDLDKGKDQDQVYLTPASIVNKYKSGKYKLVDDNYVLDHSGNQLIFKKGSFVYRIAGRDRKLSASYYTPEELTKSTVKYSVKELVKNINSLADLREVKILEPAMGSGAFLIEAVKQISELIFANELTQSSEDRRIKMSGASEKRKRLAQLKYDLISNNIFGVDLNSTAIELARFSLWLSCIDSGNEPPKLSNQFKRGNSLIGARFVKNADGIYPWLYPSKGMLNYGKRLKEYNVEFYESSKQIRKNYINSIDSVSDSYLKNVQALAERLFASIGNSISEEEKGEAYLRLKFCSDLWSSYFFLTDKDISLFPLTHQDLLTIYNDVLDKGLAKVNNKLIEAVSDLSESFGFFHWDLEFYDEIKSGGFDLILGNPPWIGIGWEDSLYVSDYNPIPAALGLTAAQTRAFVKELDDTEVYEGLAKQFIAVEGYVQMLEEGFYEKLKGVSKNTYKAFDVLGLHLLTDGGVLGLIQEDGVLEDSKSEILRREFYEKFAYHFQYQNELKLFSDIGNQKRFSVNIFSNKNDRVNFKHIGNLFLPQTIDDSFDDELSKLKEEVPLVKDENDKWNTEGHRERVITLDQETLKLFSGFLNTNSEWPVFLNLHSQPLLSAIESISSINVTLKDDLGESFVYSPMLHEVNAQDDKLIIKEPGLSMNNSQVIISGPNIFTLNPYSQQTKDIFTSKFSYDEVELSHLSNSFYPKTLYKWSIGNNEIDSHFPKLNGKTYRSFFRIATRDMVSPTNVRCSFACIIPPGWSHVNTINSIAIESLYKLCYYCGIASSYIVDGMMRLKNKSHFYPTDFQNLPKGINEKFERSIIRRVVALNALTQEYDSLWRDVGVESEDDCLISGTTLTGFGSGFSNDNLLKENDLRIQAEIEINALVALNLGLSLEELLQLFKILFSVQLKYDRKNNLDRASRLKVAYEFFDKRGW